MIFCLKEVLHELFVFIPDLRLFVCMCFCMSFLVFYGEAEMVTAGEMCGKEYFMLRDVALKHRRF